ncbi:M23 family metallopeptidase [Patulibacter minatonensis]|uniref:M23 family metallopeptidase n=1 Tax=Patulibacter minatonensis TaxID=298163 RepID=UPI0004AE2A1A|nr:M23 family metallopeptidase [Patulibacter minatonensis]
MRSSTARRAALIGLLSMAVAAPAAQADDPSGATAAGGGTPVATATPATPVAPVEQSAPTTAAVSETKTVKLTRAQTKSVQRKAHVKPDGALGARTRTAIKRYQSKKRLQPTGRPNLQTLKAMKLAFAARIEQQLAAKAATAAPKASTVAGYVFPIQGPWHWGGAGTGFGDRGGAHEGVDLMSACGTPLVAASAGKVKENKFQSAAGNYLVITDTPSGEDQMYAHLKVPSTLKVGTTVTAGQSIGLVGDTGNADGCHLHFELWTAPGWYTGGAPRDAHDDLVSWGGVPSSAR